MPQMEQHFLSIRYEWNSETRVYDATPLESYEKMKELTI